LRYPLLGFGFTWLTRLLLQAATSPLQDLYQWLEVDFHPLKLCDRVQTTLKFVENSEDMSLLQQYLPALREITLVRLLKQVAQVYQSICFERLLDLAPFADSFTLERVIVDCVRHNDMQVPTFIRLYASVFC
jgi:translation initiation factor 3 subunit A